MQNFEKILRQNRYAPEFTQQTYIFYVPLNSQPGQTFGAVEVVDKDPVIYNAQVFQIFFSRLSANNYMV